jgi:ribosomal protein S18 acetylase RimI-like enzyme
MVQKVNIRAAHANDAELIADLSRDTFYETFAEFNTKENMDMFMTGQFSKEKLMTEVMERGNIFYVAFIGDTPAGYMRMREVPNPAQLADVSAIEIARIYSVHQAIGKGVGSALMQQGITIAKEKQKQVIWLGVWEKNKRAIDFYTRWGFEKFGEHEFVLGTDVQTDWLMKKVI